MSIRLLATSSLLAFSVASQALAQQATPIPPVPVETDKAGLDAPMCSTEIDKKQISKRSMSTSDTAQLLKDAPGVDAYTGGPISSLPSIHGMASDRVKTEVNGMPITAACPNHMNPALSYIAPAQVETVKVWAGITPVSEGGDSIGGTIKVEAKPPVFAKKGEAYHTEGEVSAHYRSNNENLGGSVKVTGATENYSLTYSGSGDDANDYSRGDGKDVMYSRYRNHNHSLLFAARRENHLLTVEGGMSFVPQQGFPNQRMDMVDNQQTFGNVGYKGDFGWGTLDGRLYFSRVHHVMDFLDGRGKFPAMPGMPMDSNGTDLGYSIKAEIPLTARDTIRIGNEFHRYMLDDWWPAYGTGGMQPNDFWNVSQGVRDQYGTFGEWEAKWAPQWTTLLGMRNDTILSNAGSVQGYTNTTTYTTEAAAFNNSQHHKTDVNFDATALARFEPDRKSTYELGYAMKTRSPSLYERYTWSNATMPSEMNGWFGDANGYRGNLELGPETAHTLSVSGGWKDDSAAKEWSVRFTPYFTYIQDYIGVRQIGWLSSGANTRKLMFYNMDAEVHGVDVSGHYAFLNSPDFGRFQVKGTVGWMSGTILDSDHEESGFYHLMPLNGRFALEHELGGWNSALETELVASKTNVDNLRAEPATPAYALLNFRTAYTWRNVTLGAGVDNILDKLYYHPLAGRDYGDYVRYNGNQGKIDKLAGEGRSYNAGVTIKF
jgi:iron complex outermembrane receptor protein